MTIALIKQAKAGADIICGQIVSKKHNIQLDHNFPSLSTLKPRMGGENMIPLWSYQ